jgi:succinyl-CoA synthetase alpha subunit
MHWLPRVGQLDGEPWQGLSQTVGIDFAQLFVIMSRPSMASLFYLSFSAGKGKSADKIEALKPAGVVVAETRADMGESIAKVLPTP